MADIFVFLPLLLPIAALGLIVVPLFLLYWSDSRKHEKEWQELAKLSSLAYYSQDFSRKLESIEGIDVPNLGMVQQAISGQLKDCWFVALESVIQRHSLQTLGPLQSFVSAGFCVLVVPAMQLPEFCLCKKSGRDLLAALQAMLQQRIELDAAFSRQYDLRGQSSAELLALFDEQTRRWFLESNPLDISIKYAGDVEPTRYQLELHVKNQTLTLCCTDTSPGGKLGKRLGILPARDIQRFVDRANEIRDRLSAHNPFPLSGN